MVLLVFVLFLSVAASAQSTTSLAGQAKAALPETSGKLTAPGLQQSVTVLRDKWGVAHIYAQDQHDLFFAQGYVAAQDRLFQMELWKRVGQGRLAEVLGPGFLERDVAARLLRYRGDMAREYAAYGPDTKEILTAFTDGINAYIEARRTSAQGFPLEFKLAGFEPEPWKPEDCLMRMAGYPMTGNAGAELFHAQLVTALGVDRATALLDLAPRVKLDPSPGVDYSGLSSEIMRNFIGSDSRISIMPVRGRPIEPSEIGAFVDRLCVTCGSDDFDDWMSASNDWTVSGKLTSTGKPILANDPHRTISEPSLRYIVHLVAPGANGKPGWDVIGAGEPGLPGVAVGHNQDIAWGFTIFPIDQQDLYAEQVDPQDPNRYKTPGGWKAMELVEETFKMKGHSPVTRELKFTVHGPVVWSEGKRALALRWTGAEPGTAGYLAGLAVDRAHNWAEFEAAMAKWKLPPENIVYADRAGNIGEWSAGLAPIRKNWTGLLPVDGARGDYEWSGFVPLRELPHWFNPAQGFVATANNKVTKDPYPYNIGFSWSTPYRVDRITELLRTGSSGGKKLSLEEMGRIQTDTTSLATKQLLAILKQAMQGPNDVHVQMLLSWDANLTRDSAATILYEYWVRAMQRALSEKMLSKAGKPANPQLLALMSTRLPMPVLIDALDKPTPDVFGANPQSARDKMMLDALSAAASDVAQRQGPDPKQWSWGKLHAIRFRHSLDQITPGAAELFDQGPIERPGDGTTVNATGGFPAQTSGASYREIMDLSNWDNSLAVNTPGQNGAPGSPHYGDLVPLWDQGKYFPLSYSRELVEKNTAEKLVLNPK